MRHAPARTRARHVDIGTVGRRRSSIGKHYWRTVIPGPELDSNRGELLTELPQLRRDPLAFGVPGGPGTLYGLADVDGLDVARKLPGHGGVADRDRLALSLVRAEQR